MSKETNIDDMAIVEAKADKCETCIHYNTQFVLGGWCHTCLSDPDNQYKNYERKIIKEEKSKLDIVRNDVKEYEKDNESISIEYIISGYEQAIEELENELKQKDNDFLEITKQYQKNFKLLHEELKQKDEEIERLKNDNSERNRERCKKCKEINNKIDDELLKRIIKETIMYKEYCLEKHGSYNFDSIKKHIINKLFAYDYRVFKVKIVKCDDRPAWYNGYIGKTFEVIERRNTDYYEVIDAEQYNYCKHCGIHKDDCVIIEDTHE